MAVSGNCRALFYVLIQRDSYVSTVSYSVFEYMNRASDYEGPNDSDRCIQPLFRWTSIQYRLKKYLNIIIKYNRNIKTIYYSYHSIAIIIVRNRLPLRNMPIRWAICVIAKRYKTITFHSHPCFHFAFKHIYFCTKCAHSRQKCLKFDNRLHRVSVYLHLVKCFQFLWNIYSHKIYL